MKCIKCCAVVDDDSNYCDVGGETLTNSKDGEIKKFLITDEKTIEEEKQKREEEPENKSSKRKNIIIIIGVVLLVIAVIYLAFLKLYSMM